MRNAYEFPELVEGATERLLHGKASMRLLGSVQIGAAAHAEGVSVNMARHYETTGLLPPAERGLNGARLFSEVDVYTLRFIGRARSLGFSLHAIRKLLSLWQDPIRSNADMLQLAEQQMDELLEKLSVPTGLSGNCDVTSSVHNWTHVSD